MKATLILFIFFGLQTSYGQKSDDSKIVIKINDTSSIYQQVKYSLVNSNFIVKDNGNKDTLETYYQEYEGIYCVAKAIIKGNTIILSGAYGLKKMDDFGYTQAPKGYNRITYFKGSKGWKLLMKVANKINGQITFEK